MSFVSFVSFVFLQTSMPCLAQASLSPAQSAYLQSESRKAEDAFVRSVAQTAKARESVVRKALPAQGRITDPVTRLIDSLERDLKTTLSDDQRQEIRSADAKYRQALLDAKSAASQR